MGFADDIIIVLRGLNVVNNVIKSLEAIVEMVYKINNLVPYQVRSDCFFLQKITIKNVGSVYQLWL